LIDLRLADASAEVASAGAVDPIGYIPSIMKPPNFSAILNKLSAWHDSPAIIFSRKFFPLRI
jgi:hypothetical protein